MRMGVRPRLLSAAVLVALVAVSFSTLAALRRATVLRAGWPPEADMFYLPSPGALRLFTLGHSELGADLVMARGNVYFGSQLSTKGGQRWLARYIDTAVALDPKFQRVYMAGPAMLIYNGQNIDVESVSAAVDLLEKGVEEFPFDWELYFQLGFNLLFELPKLTGEDDPRAARWRQRGLEAFQKAAEFENIPPWLPNLVARMLTKRGSDEMAIKQLEQAYAVATTEEGRNHIRFRLGQLKGVHQAELMEEGRIRFREMVESRYPYAPDAFSVASGPRESRAIDLRSLGGTAPTTPP
jgi:hypothetical protein